MNDAMENHFLPWPSLRAGCRGILAGEKIMCTSEPKSDSPNTLRKGHEQPAATSVHGWRYHHIGIPTDVPRPGEYYLEQFKMYVSAFETSPCGIQWMRFEPDSPVHALIKSVPHIAFEVDDLQAAIEGKEILTAPNSPSEGVTVAMILDSGAPVELLEFRRDLSSGLTIEERANSTFPANRVYQGMAVCSSPWIKNNRLSGVW
jgi:hypothetical protein